MLGLFDDPFFTDPFYFWDPTGARRKQAKRAQEHERLQEQRERDLRRLRKYHQPRYWFDDDYDSEDDDEYERQLQALLDEHRKRKEEREARKQQLKEQKQKEEEEKPQMKEFSVRTRSTISRCNGVEHIKKEVFDGTTGQSQVIETKRIGDKSITVHRQTDKDGKVSEQETRENIDDQDVDAFHDEWNKLTGAKPNESIKHEESPAEKKE